MPKGFESGPAQSTSQNDEGVDKPPQLPEKEAVKNRRDFFKVMGAAAIVFGGAAIMRGGGTPEKDVSKDPALAAEAAFDAEEDTHFDQKKFDEVEKGPYGLQATLRKLTKLNEYQGEEGHSLSETDLKEIARQQERVRKLNLRINSLRSMHLTQKLEHLKGEKE